MEKTYSIAKICSFKEPANCGLSLEPGMNFKKKNCVVIFNKLRFWVLLLEITEIMSKSRDFDELKHVWTKWHEQSGGKMRQQYQKFVELSNEAARLNSKLYTLIVSCLCIYIKYCFYFRLF